MFHSISEIWRTKTEQNCFTSSELGCKCFSPIVAFQIQRRWGSVSVPIVAFQMFFTCFSALHSDCSVAQNWSLVCFIGGHQGLESIGCRWFIAVLHFGRPLGHIQGVQRIRHRCTSCSEWLPRWCCSVLRPLLICDPALRRIKEARRSFQVMHDYPCEVTMILPTWWTSHYLLHITSVLKGSATNCFFRTLVISCKLKQRVALFLHYVQRI